MGKSMVTRTLEFTKVNCKCYNRETEGIEDVELKVSGLYDEEKNLLKAVNKMLAGSSYTFVKMVSAVEACERYGMEETEFIKHAVILPPLKGHKDED